MRTTTSNRAKFTADLLQSKLNNLLRRQPIRLCCRLLFIRRGRRLRRQRRQSDGFFPLELGLNRSHHVAVLCKIFARRCHHLLGGAETENSPRRTHRKRKIPVLGEIDGGRHYPAIVIARLLPVPNKRRTACTVPHDGSAAGFTEVELEHAVGSTKTAVCDSDRVRLRKSRQYALAEPVRVICEQRPLSKINRNKSRLRVARPLLHSRLIGS